jgi:hypothetical protein
MKTSKNGKSVCKVKIKLNIIERLNEKLSK